MRSRDPDAAWLHQYLYSGQADCRRDRQVTRLHSATSKQRHPEQTDLDTSPILLYLRDFFLNCGMKISCSRLLTKRAIIIAVGLACCLAFLPVSAMLGDNCHRCPDVRSQADGSRATCHLLDCDCGFCDHVAMMPSSSCGNVPLVTSAVTDPRVFFSPVSASSLFHPPI